MTKNHAISDETFLNPAHYRFSQIEPIDVIEAWELGFHLGNVVKYVARAGRKECPECHSVVAAGYAAAGAYVLWIPGRGAPILGAAVRAPANVSHGAIRGRGHGRVAEGDIIVSLASRVLCPQCGAVRIRNSGSHFAVCPNGHGKLVRRFTKAEQRAVLEAKLPEARRVRRNKFTIDGRKGLFCYRNGSGRVPVRPGDAVEPDQVIARHETAAGRLIRVFSSIEVGKT